MNDGAAAEGLFLVNPAFAAHALGQLAYEFSFA